MSSAEDLWRFIRLSLTQPVEHLDVARLRIRVTALEEWIVKNVDFTRADGNIECTHCSEPLRNHMRIGANGFLTLGCDGTVYKL